MPDNPDIQILIDKIASADDDSLIIFDFDGTMAYTEDIHWKVFHDVVHEMFQIDYPFATHYSMTGLSYTEIWKNIGEECEFDGTSDEVNKQKEKMLSEDTGKSLNEIGRKCYGYVYDVIKAARDRNIRIGCVTSNTLRSVSTALENWNLLEDFSFMYSAATLKEDKIQIISAIASEVNGDLFVFDDSARVLKAVSEEDMTAICIGAGHPQSYDDLKTSSACDMLLDLRNSIFPEIIA